MTYFWVITNKTKAITFFAKLFWKTIFNINKKIATKYSLSVERC